METWFYICCFVGLGSMIINLLTTPYKNKIFYATTIITVVTLMAAFVLLVLLIKQNGVMIR